MGIIKKDKYNIIYNHYNEYIDDGYDYDTQSESEEGEEI